MQKQKVLSFFLTFCYWYQDFKPNFGILAQTTRSRLCAQTVRYIYKYIDTWEQKLL